MTREWENLPAELLGAVQHVLTFHVGRRNAIPRFELVREVNRITSREYSERQVRAAVNALRKQGHLILSAGGADGGYWMAKSRKEVEEFLVREVRSRYRDLVEMEKAIRAAADRVFGPPTLFDAIPDEGALDRVRGMLEYVQEPAEDLVRRFRDGK